MIQSFAVFVMVLIGGLAMTDAKDGGWPMLGHDARRSGGTGTEIRPPFERKWYRLFPDEGLLAGVQPVVWGGKVYAGTLAGILHAMDEETGKDLWTFHAGGPILHTCAASDAGVFFGSADGKIYAVREGNLLWTVPTGAAVWNAPALQGGLVLAGSRDGKLYAVEEGSGKVAWFSPVGGPFLSSPAIDGARGRVYVESEDMRVHAFDLKDGRPAWRSERLPGVSFRGYHPVIAPDGSVLITVTPLISLESFDPILLGMVKEVFGDFASWRHKKDENERLRQENFALLEKRETYEKELEVLRRRLTAEPAYTTFFVLYPETGKIRCVPPIVYAESMNGTGAPPLVTPDGKVIVKYQALLRSRYEHYSPFLNVGYLEAKTGNIEPIMDQSRTYGWHDSLLLVHDEQCQLSLAGGVLLNTHQDNVNALDLRTLKGHPSPLARNIHEPAPGEAAAIWALLLHGKELPPGKEWLPRGTAVYGGGSVIDVPVSIAGDSFYYVPSHELNSGAAIIAYRMARGGGEPPESKLPAEKLAEEDWRRIQDLPWDWDTLETPRLKNLLDALPGKVPGTRAAPLWKEAEAALLKIEDADLERFIWEAPVFSTPRGEEWSSLRETLESAVRELIGTTWRPLLFPAGKHPGEAYRVFTEPAETLYTLALAYPHLGDPLKDEVRKHVASLRSPGGPFEGPLEKRSYDPGSGEIRSAYDPSPGRLARVVDESFCGEIARLYPFWLWAHVTGDWKDLEGRWGEIRGLPGREAGKPETDCGNGRVAGLMAWARLARRLADKAALDEGLPILRKALRERISYELAHTRGGLLVPAPAQRTVFGRWRFLSPEVARLSASYACEIERRLVEVYVDRHRPTWWLAWNVETQWRNESNFALPSAALEIFSARAWILGEEAGKLRRFIDIPWCKADEFYIRKIAMTLAAAGTTAWRDPGNP